MKKYPKSVPKSTKSNFPRHPAKQAGILIPLKHRSVLSTKSYPVQKFFTG